MALETLRGFGPAALLIVGAFLAASALFFRVDSTGDLLFIRVADPIIGLLFGTAFFIAPTHIDRGFARKLLTSLLISSLVAVPLLGWHEVVTRIRWHLPKSGADGVNGTDDDVRNQQQP